MREQAFGNILNIKRFEIHDGDGMRTTLFLKGCPLRCKWCHNPESLSAKSELGYYAHKCIGCGKCAEVCPNGAHAIRDGMHEFYRAKCTACGKCVTSCFAEALMLYGERTISEKILPKLLEDKDFYKASGGGVTISGGEPLMQAAFVQELLFLLKGNGINTAIDTSLFAMREALEFVIPYTDTFLVDIKALDRDLHKELTGQYNDIILDNIRYLDSISKPMEIRIPFVPSKNACEIEKIAEFLAPLTSVKGVKVLPYHNLSGTKYDSLAMKYPLAKEYAPIPTAEEVENAENLLKSYGINVIKNSETET